MLTLLTQPQPPLRRVGASLLQWHFSGSLCVTAYIHPYLRMYELLWLPSKNIKKSYPAIPPNLPFLCCFMKFRYGGIRAENIPGQKSEDLPNLLRIMDSHWIYTTRKPSISILLVFIIHFPDLEESPHAAHKNRQWASVIFLTLESFLIFYQDLVHSWSYCFFQCLQVPTVHHLDYFPDKR